MAPAAPLPSYTPGEEIANSLTHGIGAILAIAGLAVLTAFAALYGTAGHIAASAVFGGTLIFSFTTSTLYHAIPLLRARQVLRALDHSAIFLLIAGTYTPLLLISIGGVTGWTMFSIIWSFAVAGIVARLLLKGRHHGFVVACYLVMGWAAVFIIQPLINNLEGGGLALLVGGGLAYTVGVVFYKWKQLRYSHAVWHCFVLTGSTLHFFAVLIYVLPGPATA